MKISGDVMFYAMNLILLFLFLFQLFFLRGGIYARLRLSKHSKTYIRKKSKGFLNYWIYKQINSEYPLGAIYYINIAYLISLIVFAVVAMGMGFLSVMEIPIMCICVVTAIIGGVSTVYSSISYSKADYGKAFVLLAKNKETGKLFSSLLDWLYTLVPFLIIYLNFFC